jgi:hypothetical protein
MSKLAGCLLEKRLICLPRALAELALLVLCVDASYLYSADAYGTGRLPVWLSA